MHDAAGLGDHRRCAMSQQPSSTPPEPIVLRNENPDLGVAKPKKKDKRDKKSDARRSVDTMFKVTYQNHVELSQLADSKANILMSIDGLIVSIVIAVVTPRIGSLSWAFAPALVLAAGCVVSLAFAVVASRPRLNRTPISVEQVRSNSCNILFFGQFARMPLPDFQESMNALIADQRLLHDHLIRQLYSMGQALEAKYRHLQIAYFAFLAGVCAATAALVALLVTRFGA
jgi:Family of unknown function (DUF5706)